MGTRSEERKASARSIRLSEQTLLSVRFWKGNRREVTRAGKIWRNDKSRHVDVRHA